MGGRRVSVGQSYQGLTLMTRAGLEPATYGLKGRLFIGAIASLSIDKSRPVNGNEPSVTY
jgi:hypothetical protein